MSGMSPAGGLRGVAACGRWPVFVVAGVLAIALPGCETVQQKEEMEVWKADCKQRLDTLDQRYDELLKKCNDAVAERDKLREQVDEMEASEKKRNDEFAELQRNTEKKQSNLVSEVRSEVNANLNKAITTYGEREQDLRVQVSSLKDKFTTLEGEFNDVRSDFAGHKAEIQQRQNELQQEYRDHLQRVAASYKHLLDELRSHYALCKSSLSSCHGDVVDANKKIAGAVAEITEQLGTTREQFEESLEALGTMIDKAGDSVREEANKLPQSAPVGKELGQ